MVERYTPSELLDLDSALYHPEQEYDETEEFFEVADEFGQVVAEFADYDDAVDFCQKAHATVYEELTIEIRSTGV